MNKSTRSSQHDKKWAEFQTLTTLDPQCLYGSVTSWRLFLAACSLSSASARCETRASRSSLRPSLYNQEGKQGRVVRGANRGLSEIVVLASHHRYLFRTYKTTPSPLPTKPIPNVLRINPNLIQFTVTLWFSSYYVLLFRPANCVSFIIQLTRL